MSNKIITFGNERKVCALGQGTWGMGKSSALRKDEINALRHGIDLGMNVIDTAEMYDNEELVGEAIRDCREKAFVVSKVLPGNAGYLETKRACERSLRRLGIECINLYLLHWKGRYDFSETVRAFVELKQEGKIESWGMSNLDVPDMEKVISLPYGEDCATNQVLYNLRDRGVEFDLLPWCLQHGMPVMAYSPIGEGRLKNDASLAMIAERHDATPAQIALAWVLRVDGVMAIPKAGSLKHVEENFNSMSIELTEEDLRDLDANFPAPTHKIPLAGW